MSDTAEKKPSWRRVLEVPLWLGFAGIVLGAALCLSARWFWLGEVASSFRWAFGVLAGGLGIGSIVLGAWRRGVAELLVALWSAGPILLLSLGSSPALDGRPSLKLMSANVMWKNHRVADVLELIQREDPDLLVILEGGKDSCALLDDGLSSEYPYGIAARTIEGGGPNPWEVKLFSKQPLVRAALLADKTWSPTTRQPIEAVVLLEGEPITLHIVHAPRAGRAHRNEQRDRILMDLAERGGTGERILVGDLNMTSSSPRFGQILAQGNLRDSREGFGRLASWTVADNSLVAFLGSDLRRLALSWIAIDHALVSPGLDVIDRRVEEIPGSDHRAVVVVFALGAESK